MGADNRTISTPEICPGANGRSIYKGTIQVSLSYDGHLRICPGEACTPGRGFSWAGFNLPDYTGHTPVSLPRGKSTVSIYKATMYGIFIIRSFIEMPGGRIPGL